MSTPTYVRFTEAQLDQVAAIATDYNIKTATLVRCAVQRFLHQFAQANPSERAMMLHELNPRLMSEDKLQTAAKALAKLGLDPVEILTTAAEQKLTSEATA